MTAGTPRTLLSVEPITFDDTNCQEKDLMQGFLNKGFHRISKHFKNTCDMYVKFRLAYAACASFISQKRLRNLTHIRVLLGRRIHMISPLLNMNRVVLSAAQLVASTRAKREVLRMWVLGHRLSG